MSNQAFTNYLLSDIARKINSDKKNTPRPLIQRCPKENHGSKCTRKFCDCFCHRSACGGSR